MDDLIPIKFKLPLRRSRDNSINWDYCIICQESDRTGLVPAKLESIETFKRKYQVRKRLDDGKYSDVISRLEPFINQLEKQGTKWHNKSCYAAFCNSTNIKRLQRSCSINKDKDRPHNGNLTRSQVKEFNIEKCFFCQLRKYNSPAL